MLDKNKYVVKGQSKLLSSKKNYEIVDADGKQTLGMAKDTTGFLAALFGSRSIELRQKSDDALVFSVCRSGFPIKKVQALDAQGQVLGTYKAKLFSLAGGFHVYDKDGKHFADIKGKMLKFEYTFMTPDGKTEMGSVSKTWGGMKELFTSAGTYGVQIAPGYANDKTAKMLILGASIAIDAILTKKGGGVVGGSSGGGGGDE